MIVVLGSVNLDIQFEVEILPKSGETLHACGKTHFGGGKGANQALAAKRAGADTALFGAVGNDRAAEIALREVMEADVMTLGVTVVENDTGSANIYVDRDGENCIVVAAGANGHVKTDMAVAAIEKARHGFLVLQQEIAFETNKAALELARLSDVKTVLNVSPFDQSSGELAELADIVIANEHEWAKLSSGADNIEAMREWSRKRGQTLVVTRGAAGVVVLAPETEVEVPAPAIKPIDTVGAGDTFCGYFVAELDRGGSLLEAAEIAVVAASTACLHRGAQSSIPRRSDVLNAMAAISDASNLAIP